MAVSLYNNAEGQADETTVTTGNSGGSSGDAFGAVTINSGAEIKTDTAHAAHGTKSYRISTGVSSVTVFLEWDIAAGVTTIYGRVLVFVTGTPSVSIPIVRIMDSGGVNQLARINIRATERGIEVRNAANTVVASSVTPITANAFVLLEFKCVSHASAGEITVRLHNTMDSATVTDTISATGVNTGGADIRVVRIGIPAATANQGPFWIDDLNLNDIGLPGVASASVSGSDTGAGVDALSALAAAASGAETGSGADASAPTATLAGSETASGTETGAPAAALSQTETGAGADASSLAASPAGSETAAGADVASLAAAASNTETGAGADATGGLAAAIGDTEAGSGAETGAAGVTSASSDVGIGDDGAALGATISGAETGAGLDDSATIVRSFFGSDVGIGDDGSSLISALVSLDQASGTDLAELLASIFGSDSAHARELIEVDKPLIYHRRHDDAWQLDILRRPDLLRRDR